MFTVVRNTNRRLRLNWTRLVVYPIRLFRSPRCWNRLMRSVRMTRRWLTLLLMDRVGIVLRLLWKNPAIRLVLVWQIRKVLTWCGRCRCKWLAERFGNVPAGQRFNGSCSYDHFPYIVAQTVARRTA